MIVIHKITDEGEIISIERFDKDLESTLTEIFIPKEETESIESPGERNLNSSDDLPSGGNKQD